MATAEGIRAQLRDSRIRYESVERRANNTVVATLANPADAAKAREQLLTSQQGMQVDAEGNIVTVLLPEAEIKRLAAEKTAAVRSQNFEQAAELRDKDKSLQDLLDAQAANIPDFSI